MKINEKTLIKYSITNKNVDKEGFLYKRGEINKSFQKRWCVLKGNILFYFEKRGDREPIGAILLEGSRIEVAENETELFSFNIAFGPLPPVYIFGAETQETMEGWMKALSCSTHYYLKMLVAELQKQLEDYDSKEKRNIILTQASSNAATVNASGTATTTMSNLLQSRLNPFDYDLTELNSKSSASTSDIFKQIVNPKAPLIFSKRPFIEIHEQYGKQFRDYFKNKSNSDTTDLLLL